MSISSPQPAVIHLVTLFRQISNGEIRIPAFQREFVWKEKQIIELLDSVAAGFPIGSILLWHVDGKMLKIAPGNSTSFPNIKESFPSNYVLDGMQRLSTLYGVFHFGTSTMDDRFQVAYDLDSEKFFHLVDAELFTGEHVPLSSLFSPRALLELQARLAQLPNGDGLINKLIALQSAFQEYMIPVVSIKGMDIHRIVRIFEKVNSTGTKLDPVDFMRAITWAEDFDLNHYLEGAYEILSSRGFGVNDETIIKCVGLTLDMPPTTPGLLDLRSKKPLELKAGFEKATSALLRVATFAAGRLHVHSANCIPYEGQLLLLFKTVGLETLSPLEESRIASWYWAAGFNESLRGKPDHYVARAISNWRGLVRGEVRGLEPRLKLTLNDLVERRLVSGGALATTFMAMHAARKARDLWSNEVISPSAYMDTADAEWFEPIFERSSFVAHGLTGISARLFANVALVDRSPAQRGQPSDLRDRILKRAEAGDWECLGSQFMDKQAVSALSKLDVVGFLRQRARLMLEMASKLVDEPGSHSSPLPEPSGPPS